MPAGWLHVTYTVFALQIRSAPLQTCYPSQWRTPEVNYYQGGELLHYLKWQAN